MAYRHGIYISEQQTSYSPPVTATAGLPVFIGTAPVHMTKDSKKTINRPVMVHSWDEAVSVLGYSDDWEKYSLCEAMYSQFRLYKVAPAVFINVYNPEIHAKVEDVTEDMIADAALLVDKVFPMTRLVPGLLLAPKFSQYPVVAAALTAQAQNINNHFKAFALLDLPCDTDELADYTNVPKWKETKNYVSEFSVPLWPRVKIGNKIFHLSTQLAGLMGKTDYSQGDVPFFSPSNQLLQMDSMCSDDGSEIIMGPEESNYLNGQGIATALNWIGGWRFWGNRTGAYPQNSDPKDSFIPVRRMFNWVGNSVVLSFWRRIDFPIRKILVDDIITSLNNWLAGLVAAKQLVGANVEFRTEDNPEINIMDGKLKFRIFICPSTPAEHIEFVQEFDPSYFTGLSK